MDKICRPLCNVSKKGEKVSWKPTIMDSTSLINCSTKSGDIIQVDFAKNGHPIDEKLKLALTICCGIISGCTTVGNILVLIACFLKKNLRKIRSNTFIASLALTDLIVGGLVMPYNIKYHYFNQHWSASDGDIMCLIWMFSDLITSTASIWNLVAIAIDRWMVS